MSVIEPTNNSIMEIVNGAPPPAIVADLCLEHLQGSTKWKYDPRMFYSKQLGSCDIFGFICLKFEVEPECGVIEVTNVDEPFVHEYNTGLAVGPLGDSVSIYRFGYDMLGTTPSYAPDGGHRDDTIVQMSSPWIETKRLAQMLQDIIEDNPTRIPWVDENDDD